MNKQPLTADTASRSARPLPIRVTSWRGSTFIVAIVSTGASGLRLAQQPVTARHALRKLIRPTQRHFHQQRPGSAKPPHAS
jgi:hypothetical protein